MKLRTLNCPNCGGMLNMEVLADTDSVFCSYCGKKFFLDDEKKEYTINKNINKYYETNKNINISRYAYNRYTDDAEVIKAKNESKKIWIGLIGGIIGISLFVCWWLHWYG